MSHRDDQRLDTQHEDDARVMRPALGRRGGPASWTPASKEGTVSLARPEFADARWSFLYSGDETAYASAEPDAEEVSSANRRMRAAPMPDVHGPFLKAPVWSKEVPLYFWAGGIAAGASFAAVACEAAGDREAAVIARRVALGAVVPCPPLLIADLGRPERFLNMLRILKPRSPMSTGSWCLVAFSGAAATAVAADLLHLPRPARVAGATTALLGTYLGSYTGVLLACTAVPVWARSRAFLGPIFVCTSALTGAAATRLALRVGGSARRDGTDRALHVIENASLVAHVALTAANRRRLGVAGEAIERGRPGLVLRGAEGVLLAGLAAQLGARVARRRSAVPWIDDAASAISLAAGLAVRIGWIDAGRMSARNDEAAAAMGREPSSARVAADASRDPRMPSTSRMPLRLPVARRGWAEMVRRASLAVERRVRRERVE
jgi:formate-dependent nitrite reductase membrane component NrfD